MSTANTPALKQAFWWPKNSTTSRVLTGTDSGVAWTNTNATASVTFTLPKAAVGLTAVVSGLAFQFLVAAAHSVVITPKTGDTIRGLAASAPLTLTSVGQFVQLECVTANFWEVTNGNTFPDGVTINGTTSTLGGNTIATTQVGTFTGSVTGCTGTVTGTVTYTIVGQHCTLTYPAGMAGTSNTTAMTMTGLPAVAQPATQSQVVACSLEDNTANTLGAAQVVALSSTITFFRSVVVATAVTVSASGFTAAGSKGLNETSFTYSLA